MKNLIVRFAIILTVSGLFFLFSHFYTEPISYPETVETIQSKNGKTKKSINEVNWTIYQNKEFRYEFKYPNSYSLKNIAGAVLLKGKNIEWFITVDEISRYPKDEFNSNKISFEEFVITVSKLMCSADSVDMSIYCTDVIKKTLFNNPNKLKVIELYLTEINEYHFEGEKPRTEIKSKGPIYIVRLSKPDELYRGLFFRPEEFKKSSTDKKIIKEIINTVKVLQME